MNISKYRADIISLVNRGKRLLVAMALESGVKVQTDMEKKELDELPDFRSNYQTWYSEESATVRQLLPDRVDDFVEYYKPTKVRKEITYANYTISDYLQGLNITRGYQKEKIVGPDAAVPTFRQQVNILDSITKRFESTLFDIRSLVQADFFDSELDVGEELNKKGFHRAAGAVAGVALEGHLLSVAEQHKLSVPKDPSISKLNDLLKKSDVIDMPNWRFVQRLGDLRNLCDHKKDSEPSKDNIHELIEGVRKIIKTIF